MTYDDAYIYISQLEIGIWPVKNRNLSAKIGILYIGSLKLSTTENVIDISHH